MSFKSNDSQQITLNDALFGPTDREKRMLEKSLAKPFAEKIFPKIDESLFACLYYHATNEGGMAWNDPEIGIEWPELRGRVQGQCKRRGLYAERWYCAEAE